MTGTIVDALQDATTALNAATAEILALQQSLSQQAAQSQQAATTVINNFLSRPATLTIFCDPVNGNDSNDGATITTPKKSLDSILANIGITATEILLLNDALISSRCNVQGSLTIEGVQPSAAAPGFIPFTRTITFLGTSTNSPAPLIGTFCSGAWFYSPFAANYINFLLPPQPAGQTDSAHLHAFGGQSFSIFQGTILVADQTAGSLFGSDTHSIVSLNGVTYGQGAAGHIFRGVAAGANPNNLFAYVSNVTSG